MHGEAKKKDKTKLFSIWALVYEISMLLLQRTSETMFQRFPMRTTPETTVCLYLYFKHIIFAFKRVTEIFMYKLRICKMNNTANFNKAGKLPFTLTD